jgi:hypothetical protein
MFRKPEPSRPTKTPGFRVSDAVPGADEVLRNRTTPALPMFKVPADATPRPMLMPVLLVVNVVVRTSIRPPLLTVTVPLPPSRPMSKYAAPELPLADAEAVPSMRISVPLPSTSSAPIEPLRPTPV